MNNEKYIKDHWIKNKIYLHDYHIPHVRRFKECAKYLVGNRFAEIGCACGDSIYILNRLHPGDWHGYDISSLAIEKARKHFPQFKFDIMYNNSIRKENDYFDSIVCTEVIEHCINPIPLIREAIRVTKYNAIFSTPSKYVKDPTHVVVYTKYGLEQLFGPKAEIFEKKEHFYIVYKKEAK